MKGAILAPALHNNNPDWKLYGLQPVEGSQYIERNLKDVSPNERYEQRLERSQPIMEGNR